MPANKKAQPEAREKALRALALHRKGLVYREIADQLGYANESGARHAVERLLGRVEVADAGAYRASELERLAALQAAWWDSAISGDDKAAGVILKIIDRRCRLLGLDAPTQVAVSGSGEPFDAKAIADRLIEIARLEIDTEEVKEIEQ